LAAMTKLSILAACLVDHDFCRGDGSGGSPPSLFFLGGAGSAGRALAGAS
jgi:hypothetical protein